MTIRVPPPPEDRPFIPNPFELLFLTALTLVLIVAGVALVAFGDRRLVAMLIDLVDEEDG